MKVKQLNPEDLIDQEDCTHKDIKVMKGTRGCFADVCQLCGEVIYDYDTLM